MKNGNIREITTTVQDSNVVIVREPHGGSRFNDGDTIIIMG